MDTKQRDKKYLGREGAAKPLVVAKSKGSYMYNDKGVKYIDFFAGWCVGNVGWNVDDVIKQIRKFDGPTYVTPTYYYKAWAELAELLAQIAPGKLTKSFRATGGTEAIEIAMQAAMSHTKRSKFISVEGSYHGHSIGAMSIGMSDFRKWYSNLLPDCYKISAPLDEAAARKVEKLLSKKDIAAFICEPIVCNLAVEIPTKKFFDIVQAACKKYGTVLVIDEVASGFGRTGKMFASEHYGLKPDIMTIAKGATGGYGALGATLMTPELAKSFEFDFSYYSTFGWTPINVEATLANLRYLLKNKSKFLQNAQKLSKYFESRLRKMQFKIQPQIRVKGLAIGMEFGQGEYPSGIIDKALEKGLLIANASGNNIIMFPPLDISLKVAKEGLDIFESCL